MLFCRQNRFVAIVYVTKNTSDIHYSCIDVSVLATWLSCCGKKMSFINTTAVNVIPIECCGDIIVS